MQATVSFIVGVLLAIIILAISHRRGAATGEPSARPPVLGWWTLAFGLIAAAAFVLGLSLTPRTGDSGSRLLVVSITFASAAVVLGIGMLVRRDRHWPTWVGLVTGVVIALFWIAFAAGYIFGFGE